MENEEEQYQKKLQRRYHEAVKRAQVERQMAEIAKQLLEPSANERLSNIKASNPELYRQLVNMLISLAQAKRIQGRISEEQFKSLLEKVTRREEFQYPFQAQVML